MSAVRCRRGVPEEETFFDGYSLGWWRDREAFDATMQSPGWRALLEDGANVFDMSQLWGAVLKERVVKGERELVGA
jgi:hypothetical protein